MRDAIARIISERAAADDEKSENAGKIREMRKPVKGAEPGSIRLKKQENDQDGENEGEKREKRHMTDINEEINENGSDNINQHNLDCQTDTPPVRHKLLPRSIAAANFENARFRKLDQCCPV